MTIQLERTTQAEALRLFLKLMRPQPLADPYPLYARLREIAPSMPIRFPGVPSGHLVSTFEGCSQLLRDPAFGPPTHEHLDALKPGWRDNSFTRSVYSSMVFHTGRSHRERRQPASRHFAPRAVSSYASEVEHIVDTLLDQLTRRSGTTVDLMTDLALPFASLTLGRLLSIDDAEAIRLGRLARQVGTVFEQFATAAQHKVVAESGAELVNRLASIVSVRRDGRQDDLLSALAVAEPGEEDHEKVGAAVLLFGAGFDSPASMVGLGTRLLLDHPAQAEIVRDDPAFAAPAVEEILRFEPPVQLVARAARRPAHLAGADIAEGGLVLGLIAAANRDSAQVKEPDRFDITREQIPSLSFGAGPHYCLGAYLARMQGQVLFPRLLRRFPGMRLAGEPVFRSPGSALRGLDNLPVHLGP
jgi:cytochrome P450